MLKHFLFFLGFLTLTFIIWHIGLEPIADVVSEVGLAGILALLIPSVIMYAIEAYGWKITIGPSARGISFWRIFTIRTAGEVVNMSTPTAYVGGEPLKAYFLKKYNVPIVEGLASVIIAKTTMTIAEVLFILLGIAVAFLTVGSGRLSRQMFIGTFLSVGLLLFGTAVFVFAQQEGLCVSLLEFSRKIRLRIPYLEAREKQLRLLDRTILEFYRDNRPSFYLSTGLFFLAWLAEALEVYAILYCLGGPAMAHSAISIGAFSVFIKGSTFFIPGSLGTQDVGNLFLLKAFGYSDVTGITFALLRRFREVVWLGLGLLCLASIRERPVIDQNLGLQDRSDGS